MNASEWSLPAFLSWMPIETIVWTMGLLLSEIKLVVIGTMVVMMMMMMMMMMMIVMMMVMVMVII